VRGRGWRPRRLRLCGLVGLRSGAGGETVVVLAVLAGVVKVLGLDAAAVEGVGCEEKDLKRNS